MDDMKFQGRTGDERRVPGSAVEAFDRSLGGTTIAPGDEGYDDARTLWNTMIDRRPALFARCSNAEDVRHAVRFAREHDLLLAVKGAGHNVAGNALCDGGLVIDLSAMNEVHVDPAARTARVGPGAILQDLDGATQAHGLATPVGYNSTTGIAGLTLGGGFGWLSRKYGLTIDNLLSAELVTAEGEEVRADAEENPELFWGIRGGGGNFGIVTGFEFRLHPVGPEVFSGPIVYRGEDAVDVLRNARAFNDQAPDEATTWVVLRKAPPLPFLEEDVVGTDVAIVVSLYAGDMEEAKEVFAPLRAFGEPIADAMAPHPYAGFQQAFDGLNAAGLRNYWKSHNFTALSDEAIEILVDGARRLPTPDTEVAIPYLAGAVGRVPADATAYPHRDATWLMNLHTRWSDPEGDEAAIGWARGIWEALVPHAMGGSYVNFISEEEGEERSAYSANWERLVALKNHWDPDNVFRLNQNVSPTE
jgi:FAD/FMN-containing dehydrogenase